MTTNQQASDKSRDDVENPYCVLSPADGFTGQSKINAGRWNRSLQVLASVLAIFFLLVNIASVYEIWRSFGAPPPWNSPRWRSDYFRTTFLTSLGFVSSAFAAFRMPSGEWSGRVLLGIGVVLLFSLFGAGF